MPSPKRRFTPIAVCTCALPGCQEEFLRANLEGKGFRRYHSEACSKAAKKAQSVRHGKSIKAEKTGAVAGLRMCL